MSLTGTDHCNSTLSKTFPLEKESSAFFLSIFQKMCQKIIGRVRILKGLCVYFGAWLSINEIFDVILAVFFVNFEHISNLFLSFLLLTLNKQMLTGLPSVRRCSTKFFLKF